MDSVTWKLAVAGAALLLAACPEDSSGRDGGSGGSGGSVFATGGASGAAGMGGMGGVNPAGGGGGVGGSPVGGSGSAGGTGGQIGPRVFDAGSDPNRNKVTPGTLCERMATIQCAGEAFCCDNPGRDRDSCFQTMFNGCKQELYLDVIGGANSSGFDPAVAEAAFTEYERLASTCDANVAQWGVQTSGLRGIMQGTVTPGGDCAPEGFSLSNPTPPSNEEAAIALASCASIESNACMPGLIGWDCEPRVGLGGDCFSDVNCTDGLFCDNPDLSISGDQCKQRKSAGASCQYPNECASLACKGGQCAAAGDVQAAYCLN